MRHTPTSRNAACGKRGHSAVATFEYRLEENLLSLQTGLRERTYRPGAGRNPGVETANGRYWTLIIRVHLHCYP
jgi:hypothetical protein